MGGHSGDGGYKYRVTHYSGLSARVRRSKMLGHSQYRVFSKFEEILTNICVHLRDIVTVTLLCSVIGSPNHSVIEGGSQGEGPRIFTVTDCHHLWRTEADIGAGPLGESGAGGLGESEPEIGAGSWAVMQEGRCRTCSGNTAIHTPKPSAHYAAP